MMSSEQKTYMLAKALQEVSDEAVSEYEARWLKGNGFLDKSGKPYKHIWCIREDDLFEKACDGIEKDRSYKDLRSEFMESQARLNRAEEQLIEWALKFIPRDMAEALSVWRKDVSIRKRLVDIAFRLEALTVPYLKESALNGAHKA